MYEIADEVQPVKDNTCQDFLEFFLIWQGDIVKNPESKMATDVNDFISGDYRMKQRKYLCQSAERQKAW